MEKILMEKLRQYIAENNPDLLVGLQEGYSFSQFLQDRADSVASLILELEAEGKPPYVIEELCLEQMTAGLRPSRFDYVRRVLEEEFSEEYLRLEETGVLTYELINMLEACNTVFDDYGFSEENEENRFFKYAVIVRIHDYLV